jgi:hypothetical protein
MKDEKEKNVQTNENEVISPFGYFLRDILYAIPLVGLIAVIVNAIDAANINVRNHARGRLINFGLAFIFMVLYIAFIISVFMLGLFEM